MLSLGLVNSINYPTRESNNSSSLIDNIFISNSLSYISGIFDWDVSDHYAIFAFIKNIFTIQNNVENISYRLINETTISNFRNSISTIDFSSILQSNDIDFSMYMLDSLILEHYNQHCPVITKKISKKDREKPWITNHLKRLITMRQKHYRWFKNDIISHECFKEFRNHVTLQLKTSKKEYFHNLLQQARNNMRKVWNIGIKWNHKASNKLK